MQYVIYKKNFMNEELVEADCNMLNCMVSYLGKLKQNLKKQTSLRVEYNNGNPYSFIEFRENQIFVTQHFTSLWNTFEYCSIPLSMPTIITRQTIWCRGKAVGLYSGGSQYESVYTASILTDILQYACLSAQMQDK